MAAIPGMAKPHKRLFMMLLCLSFIGMSTIAFLIWRVSYLGLLEINVYLPTLLGALIAGAALLTGFGILSMVGAILGMPFFSVFQRRTYTLINMLFPVVVMLGKSFGISRRKIERSFIEVSNQIIHHRHIKVRASELLVVTPHCLQLASCPHKVTRDPNNCKRCGGCDVGALVKLAEEMGFHFFIVTGGTLARQTVKKLRPKAVLAIACERDLTSGIQDVYPLPAVGVMNLRPNGPCYNTHVDIEAVRAEVEKILVPEDIRPKEDEPIMAQEPQAQDEKPGATRREAV
ncbi:DUF116 domain-containing protein [Selenomonas sp. TAMA-11512]|uniref:DUF116 domain-containing protein n=1 Tax=Selenomonas sp. TAMA-11512 TaxID=3095337 RepID=UPI00308D8D08|nr:DUF116 domain-containing protein [Selenomonas sp. TAMA-11512]